MTLPEHIRVRAGEAGDLAELAEVRNGALLAAGETPEFLWTAESLAAYLDYPRIDREQDFLMAEALPPLSAGEARPAAFLLSAASRIDDARGGPAIEIWELFVNPFLARRGVGRALVEEAASRARARGLPRLRTAMIPAERAGALVFLRRCGFEEARRFDRLAAGDLEAVAGGGDEIEAQSVAPEIDLAPLAAAYNKAFGKSWGIEPQSAETLAFALAPRPGCEALHLTVKRDGRIAAFVFAQADSAGGVLSIESVGTVPDAQRGGLARGLLTQCARRARELGCTRASVTVDAENAPAHALYAGLGFTPSGSDVVFVRNSN